VHVSSSFKEGELWNVLPTKETLVTSLEMICKINVSHTPSVAKTKWPQQRHLKKHYRRSVFQQMSFYASIKSYRSDYADGGLEKELSKHVRKVSTQLKFGPGYSSDNAGDGPRGARFRCPITGRFLKTGPNTRDPSPPRDEPVSIEEEIAEKDLWVFPNLPRDIGVDRNLVCQSRFDSGELWLYQPGVPLHLQDPRKRSVLSVQKEQPSLECQANLRVEICVNDNNDNASDLPVSAEATRLDDEERVDLSQLNLETSRIKPNHIKANVLGSICLDEPSDFSCGGPSSREVHGLVTSGSQYTDNDVKVSVLNNGGTSNTADDGTCLFSRYRLETKQTNIQYQDGPEFESMWKCESGVSMHIQAQQRRIHSNSSDDAQPTRISGIENQTGNPFVQDPHLELDCLCKEKGTQIKDDIDRLCIAGECAEMYGFISSIRSATYLKDAERRRSRRRRHKFLTRELGRIKKRALQKWERDMKPDYLAGTAERWMLKKRQEAFRDAWVGARDSMVKKVKTSIRIAHIRKLSKVRQQKFYNPAEREARRRSDWHKFEAALTEENDQLKNREEVLEFMTRHNIPKGVNVLGSRYALQIKRSHDGTIDKYEARFVAFENQQKKVFLTKSKAGLPELQQSKHYCQFKPRRSPNP
jgi:hypothetical protein